MGSWMPLRISSARSEAGFHPRRPGSSTIERGSLLTALPIAIAGQASIGMTHQDFHTPFEHVGQIELHDRSGIALDLDTARAINFVEIFLCADTGIVDKVERFALDSRHFRRGDQSSGNVFDQNERQRVSPVSQIGRPIRATTSRYPNAWGRLRARLLSRVSR